MNDDEALIEQINNVPDIYLSKFGKVKVIRLIESLRPEIKSDRDKLLIELGELIVEAGVERDETFELSFSNWTYFDIQKLFKQIKEEQEQ